MVKEKEQRIVVILVIVSLCFVSYTLNWYVLNTNNSVLNNNDVTYTTLQNNQNIIATMKKKRKPKNITNQEKELLVNKIKSLNIRQNGQTMTNETRKLLKLDSNIFLTYSNYPLTFINKCEEKCKKDKKINLVFLINSYILNIERRNAIRATWGNETRLSNYTIKHVFLFGTYNNYNQSILNIMKREDEIYNDIVIGDFQDSYHNNSLKCMMALQWAKKYCNNSLFYIISDDDSYFNIKNLIQYLITKSKNDFLINYPTMISELDDSFPMLRFFGGVRLFGMPFRDGKYTLSENYYPYEQYPPYVNGHSMVFSNDIIDLLIDASKHVKFIWLDDIYFAFLALWANINIESIPNIEFDYPKEKDNDREFFDNKISVHYITSAQVLLNIWQQQLEAGTV